MRIKIKTKGGLAVNCRTTVYFEKDEFLEIGSKASRLFTGLSKKDLDRLVELDLAVDVSTDEGEEKSELDESEESEEKSELDESEEKSELDESEEKSEPEYKTFVNKSDLENYAKKKYKIDLNKRKTLDGMIKQLENELGGEL